MPDPADNSLTAGNLGIPAVDGAPDWLKARSDEARWELGRTDTKAATLLTLAVAALALLAGALTSRVIPAPAAAVGWAAAAVVAAAVALLALTVRPNLDGTPPGTVLLWAAGPGAIRVDMAADLTDRDRRIRQLASLSQIAVEKYHRLRLAVHLLLTALALAAVVPALAVICR